MTVAYAEYGPHVGDQDALRLTVAGAVEETGQVVAKELRVRLHTPELTLTVRPRAGGAPPEPPQGPPQTPRPLWRSCWPRPWWGRRRRCRSCSRTRCRSR